MNLEWIVTLASTLGFNPEKPVLVLLHGLNGGSTEGYVMDCVEAAQKEGWTVAVFIARGAYLAGWWCGHLLQP